MDRAAHAERKPEMAAEARRYLDLAVRLLRPRPGRLVAIGGLSGSGKSTLAAALAPGIEARVMRSDVIRKRLFGVAPETRLPASHAPEVSHRVYETFAKKARRSRRVRGDHRCRILKPRNADPLPHCRGSWRPVYGFVAAAGDDDGGSPSRAPPRRSDASPEVLAQQPGGMPVDRLACYRCRTGPEDRLPPPTCLAQAE